MVEVGMRLLSERGLTVGLDTVKFDETIVEADVPRASAYRAWSSDDPEGPQVQFHDALAARLLTEQPGFSGGDRDDHNEGALASTMEAVEAQLASIPDFEGLDAAGRQHWFRQIHRAGSNANQLAMDNSVLWQCYIAVAAGLMSQTNVEDHLLDAWRAGEEGLVERYKALYSSMAETFRFRLRDCYTYDQFDTAAAALAEGLTIRSRINPHTRGIMRSTGADGQEQEWTLFAICFEGLLRQFFEPINDPPYAPLDHE